MAKFKEACVVTFVLAMVVLMVLLPRHARADDEGCALRDAVIASVTANHPAQMVVLDRDQSARVSTWWDAQPPVSEDHYGLAIILRDTAHHIALLMGKDGLVCKATLVPPEVVPSLLNAIEGQRSGLPLILVQEVHSHPGMSVDVNRFYSTWFRPMTEHDLAATRSTAIRRK
jgi:hypothetical protein